MSEMKGRFGGEIRYPKSHGDLWTATWADDGAVYVAADDTRGIDDSCRSNLAVFRIDGEEPPDVTVETINPMTEYGTIGERKPVDNGMWKACGLISVDGVLYLSVSRHTYPWDGFSIQRAWDATIVKSEDHGRSWSPMPEIGGSMFPGYAFATPFFVQFGRDGDLPHIHGAGEYVYAVSNDGTWGDGNTMTLGRVRRGRLPRLDPSDWQFFDRFDKEGNPLWQDRFDTAGFIFRAPARTSMTGIHYIDSLGCYIMPQWYHNRLEESGQQWRSTCVDLYRAEAPWGPWTLFHSREFRPQGWYNPCIPLKYVSADGSRMWVLVSGDWTTAKSNEAMYGLFMVPLEIDTSSG